MTTLPTDESLEPRMIEEIGNTLDRPVADRLSVVIPAYNEAEHVREQIAAVREVVGDTGWPFEIIVVDDGSNDETATRAAEAGARVLRHRRNMGYGAALKTGIRAAKHDWILITDADGTYPAEAIPTLLQEADHHDMVVGSRTGERVSIPLLRRPAKWFLRRLASYLAGVRIPDLNSGLRLMRRGLVERYEHLLPDGFSFTTTITLASLCNLHPVSYVPIDYLPRLGDSKIRSRHAYDFLLLILRTMVYFNPLKVFLPAGAVLMLAGIVKFVYDIVLANLSESAVLAVLGALLLWAVGLLADQNSRIAMSTRR